MSVKDKLKYTSIFDIIGPIMIGPSSSHTAGAVKIGRMAKELFGESPKKVKITFFGSFAETYKGHGTAVAIVAGILGFEPSDNRIPDSVCIAEEKGIQLEFVVSQEKKTHPNTVTVTLASKEHKATITGISIGGGTVELIEVNHSPLGMERKNSSGLILITTSPESRIRRIEELLKEPRSVVIQQIGEKRLYFIESLTDSSQQLISKINKIDGITLVLATTW